MTMTPGENIPFTVFVDTNIWLYSTDPHSPFHERSLLALDRAQDNGAIFVTSPQVLREYVAVGTRPNASGVRASLSDLLANVATIRSRCQFVEETAAVVDQLASLLMQVPASHRRIHDANIVATMLTWNVSHLLTHNVADFVAYGHLIRIVPLPDPAP